MNDTIHRLFAISYELHVQRHGDWTDRDRPVIVLVHGIGVNHHIWRPVLRRLSDWPVLMVDLLGFGQSRQPEWPRYTVRDHANALRKTIRRQTFGRPIILCGHSLGALVAIEYAKRFSYHIAQLVLCSPPIYTLRDMCRRSLREAALQAVGRQFLRVLDAQPGFIKAVNQYRLTQKNFYIDPDNMTPYLKTAHNSILHQTALVDAMRLPQVPLTILYGTLDTVMIPANFRVIARHRANTTITPVLAGHEIRKRYGRAIAAVLVSDSVGASSV